MTITLGWWAIPIGLCIGGMICWYLGSKETGMFGGMNHFWIGAGLLVAAAASALVGWLK